MQLVKTILTISIACLGIVVSNASAEPAVVVKVDDFEAAILDGDGNIVVLSCASMQVETNSETGVINFSCRGKDAPNSSGRAVNYDIYNNPFYWEDGILIPAGLITADGTLVFTENWAETISASGNFAFRGQVKID